jgi:hypothetical protein
MPRFLGSASQKEPGKTNAKNENVIPLFGKVPVPVPAADRKAA